MNKVSAQDFITQMQQTTAALSAAKGNPQTIAMLKAKADGIFKKFQQSQRTRLLSPLQGMRQQRELRMMRQAMASATPAPAATSKPAPAATPASVPRAVKGNPMAAMKGKGLRGVNVSQPAAPAPVIAPTPVVIPTPLASTPAPISTPAITTPDLTTSSLSLSNSLVDLVNLNLSTTSIDDDRDALDLLDQEGELPPPSFSPAETESKQGEESFVMVNSSEVDKTLAELESTNINSPEFSSVAERMYKAFMAACDKALSR